MPKYQILGTWHFCNSDRTEINTLLAQLRLHSQKPTHCFLQPIEARVMRTQQLDGMYSLKLGRRWQGICYGFRHNRNFVYLKLIVRNVGISVIFWRPFTLEHRQKLGTMKPTLGQIIYSTAPGSHVSGIVCSVDVFPLVCPTVLTYQWHPICHKYREPSLIVHDVSSHYFTIGPKEGLYHRNIQFTAQHHIKLYRQHRGW